MLRLRPLATKMEDRAAASSQVQHQEDRGA